MIKAFRAALLTTALLSAMGAVHAETTLKAVMHSPLRLTDPHATTAYITTWHGYMIYDTLLATDADNKIQPQMADKWEISPDGKTYTFTLRDGLKWHDVTPVKAEDCVTSVPPGVWMPTHVAMTARFGTGLASVGPYTAYDRVGPAGFTL